MNIILVSQYFGELESDNHGRFVPLYRYLKNKGHDVKVITSNFIHHKKKFYKNCAINDIFFVSVPGYKKNVSIARLISILIFTKKLRKILKEVAKHYNPDVIYCGFPPCTPASVCIKIAKRFNIPLIVDVQDLWPEGLIVAWPHKLPVFIFNAFTLPWKIFENYIFKKSNKIITVSMTFSERVSRVRTDTVPFFYLGADFKVISEDDIKSRKKLVTYIGTLSYSYDVLTLIDAAYKIKCLFPEVGFKIYGSGPSENFFREYNNRLGSVIDFCGHIPYQELEPMIKKAYIGVNPIIEKNATSMPNKVFQYFAGGVPVLNSLKGELGELIDKYNAGITYNAGDSKSLAEAIEYMLGLSCEDYQRYVLGALEIAKGLGNREIINGNIESFIRKVVENKKGHVK